MLKKWESECWKDLNEWLPREEALHLNLLADLERFGPNTPYHEIWEQVNGEGVRLAVVRRFFGRYDICVTDREPDLDELSAFFLFACPESVMGRTSDIRATCSMLPGQTETLRFMQLPGDAHLKHNACDAEMAGPTDVPAIARLVHQTETFGRLHRSEGELEAGIRKRMRSGKVRHFVIRREQKVVAHAATTAETERFAMLSGIVVASEEQRKGYATRIVSRLCRVLLSEGKQPCLYCKSSAAYALYQRLGFEVTSERALWLAESQSFLSGTQGSSGGTQSRGESFQANADSAQ